MGDSKDGKNYKERTVEDLIRLVKNNYEDRPNFSLLLGSGCSFSSGIRTAGELIYDWRREVFFQNKHDVLSTDNFPDDYFNQFDWYKSDKEYACFFEKLYDLPIHRKEFIEREIFGKTPSLGYAYLVKLVETGRFNTIFTTNFDDLINEAFYTYGGIKNRPIVCAHDSSIQSITPLSKRPKILKLHGDYLFDNFKTSEGETKSLEGNLKIKVEEFARITGLIVIGYAGHDDSVMNVLEELLKRKTFYQHGVYWCMRKQDTLSDKVQNLLNNERCYLVYIDGFDEIMCQIGLSLKVDNPIELITVDNSTEILDAILTNERLNNTTSPFLKKQLRELTEKRNKLTLQDENDKEVKSDIDSEDAFNADDLQDSDMAVNDRNILSRLQKKTDLEEYDSVLEEIDSLLSKKIEKRFNEQLRTLKGEIYYNKELFEKARKVINSLISDNPYRTYNYLNLIACTQKYSDKLKIIDTAISYCPYVSALYVTKAQILHKIDLEKTINCISPKNNSIQEVLLEGEKYSRNADSDCWQYYFDYNYGLSKPGDKAPEECKAILNEYDAIFPRHFEVISRKIELLKLEKADFGDIDQYINKFRFGDKKEDLSYDLLRLRYVYDLHEIEKTKDLLQQYNLKYSDFQQYILTKAEIEYSLLRDLKKSSHTLQAYLDDNKEKKNLSVKKALITNFLYQGDFESALEIINNSEKKKQLEKLYKIKVLECQKMWENVIDETITKEQSEGETITSLMVKSHALLMLGEFEEVKNLLHPSIEKNQQPNPVLVINCELADSKIRESKTKKSKKRQRIELIATSEECDKAERAAAYIILDNFDAAKLLIIEDLRDDFSNEQTYANCYVFNKYKGDIVSPIIESVRNEALLL